MGRVEALCISPEKGTRKQVVPRAVFLAGAGIQDDAHAGAWHRQVSILAAEEIEQVRRRGLPDLPFGAFAENVVLAGVALDCLGPGSQLRLGADALLTITQIGKTCHKPCRIQRISGDCIMPRAGLFARVLNGGDVNVGDAAEVVLRIARDTIQTVVLTMSDRCWRGEAIDTAGPAVAAQLRQSLKAHVYIVEVLPDEQRRIAGRLRHYCDGHSIDLVVTVGGTGWSPRDVTPEATREVVRRLTPGLDEAMRAASLAHTPRAMLSRGVSGIRGATLVINLPGSERAAVENLLAILPSLSHGLAKLRGDPADCGRPETARP
ncbi:MAG: molybdenum cofactor synthesis domain-containing protein [Thermoguttaceae bacterium]|jgi:molybdenum cofactor synthesis domain-containing protein